MKRIFILLLINFLLLSVVLLTSCTQRKGDLKQPPLLALETRLKLGHAYLKAHQFDAAHYHFDRILTFFPQNSSALIGLAIIARCKGQNKIALNYEKLAMKSGLVNDTVLEYLRSFDCK